MAESTTTLIDELRRLVGRAGASNDPDAILLGRFVENRAEDAFAALVYRHGPMVLRVCRRVVGDVQLAEDAFQATFLVLARKARKIRRRHSVAAWLHGVALRVARKARRGKGIHTTALLTIDCADPRGDPLSQLTARELLGMLDEEIQRLPEVYRLPLILCALEGLSQKEAARWLGWSEGSLRGRLERGRERLRQRLAYHGVALTAACVLLEGTRGAVRAGLTNRLVNHTAEVALAYAGYQAGTVITASTAVVKLAGAALKSGAVLKMTVGLVTALLIGITTIGAAGLARWAGDGAGNQEAGTSALPPLQQAKHQDEQPRLDLYGDPLPAGALARLGTVRFRHDGEAMDIAMSADAKMLAANTRSGLIIWNAANGKEILRSPRINFWFRGHTLDFSPDGSVLAVSLGLGKVELRDSRSGKLRSLEARPRNDLDRALPEETSDASLRFTPDGKSLALFYRKQIHVFDVATGQCRTSIADIPGGFNDLAFSPNGKTVALAFVHPTAQLWDIATGKMLNAFHDAGKSSAFAVAFSQDGRTLAVGRWDQITLYDSASGKELIRFDDAKMHSITDLRFTPDGTTLVSASQDGRVRVWDIATGKAIHTLPTRMVGRSAAFSADCKIVAMGTTGSTVKLWDASIGKELFTEFQGHDAEVHQLVFAPDGKSLFSTEGGSEGGWHIRQWDTTTWHTTKILPHSANMMSVSPDSKRLAWVGHNDTVRIWDMAKDKEAMTIKVPDTTVVGSAVFSPDGLKIFTSNVTSDGEHTWAPHYLRQWDAMTGKHEQKWTLGPNFAPTTYAGGLVVRNGKSVVSDKDGAIQFHDIELGRERLFDSRWGTSLAPLAVSTDCRLLASGDIFQDFALRIWEMATGKEVFALKGHGTAVTDAAWSSDGCFLASADDNTRYTNLPNPGTTIRLWSAINGQELFRIDGLNSAVRSLAISPDGRYLAAGMRDSTILVWDISKAVRQGKLRAIQLNAQELEACWAELAGKDAVRAHRAVWKLIAAEPQAVPFLQSQLKPVAVSDAAKIQRWIVDLDSDKFTVRQTAARELVIVGEQVRAPIQKALEANIPLESRRRLEQVIKDLPDVPGPETLRSMRAIMTLEKIGSAEARAVLVALATGAPTARVTREAEAALIRLRPPLK